jgi:phosphoglycerate dehydrogenase-like enzyme
LWERFCGGEALGKTALVVGYGAVGRVVGQYLEALGVHVYGINSRGLARIPTAGKASGQGIAAAGVAELLDRLLPVTDYLVIALPGVRATEGLISRQRLESLPQGAMVINVGRGSVVDEEALIDLLSSGHIASAALDVFATEPLPAGNPLWSMPNVLINPHSASTSDRENGRITDIFIDNIGRYLRGEPLRNVFQPERGY